MRTYFYLNKPVAKCLRFVVEYSVAGVLKPDQNDVASDRFINLIENMWSSKIIEYIAYLTPYWHRKTCNSPSSIEAITETTIESACTDNITTGKQNTPPPYDYSLGNDVCASMYSDIHVRIMERGESGFRYIYVLAIVRVCKTTLLLAGTVSSKSRWQKIDSHGQIIYVYCIWKDACSVWSCNAITTATYC